MRKCDICNRAAAKKDVYCRRCGDRLPEIPFLTKKEIIKKITRPIIRIKTTGPTECPECINNKHPSWKFCTQCGRDLKKE